MLFKEYGPCFLSCSRKLEGPPKKALHLHLFEMDGVNEEEPS